MKSVKNEYKQFLKTLALATALMWGLIVGFNFVADPFDMNDLFNLGGDVDYSNFPAADRVGKIARYSEKPCPNIVIGDSRVKWRIDTGYIREVTGEEYFNMGFGGGTLKEIFSAFWYAAGETKLKNVYIFLGFSNFGGRNQADKVTPAVHMSQNKLSCYSSLFTTRNSLAKIRPRNSGASRPEEEVLLFNRKDPDKKKDDIWKAVLGDASTAFYHHFVYPDYALLELEKIKQYCDKNGIKLVFVIIPTHVALKRKVVEFNLTAEYNRFKKDLAGIAPTVDFDYPNEWTTDLDAFDDPYHFSIEVGHSLIDEVWKENYRIGHKLN